MAGRGELNDAAWERIEPLLPQVDGRGRPWRDHRQVVNGVLWRLRTGLRGVTCRSGMGRGRPSTSDSPAGRRMARGQGCWSMRRSVTTRWAGWSGPSRSIPRSTVPTSTPPAHVKRGRRRGRTGRSGPLADAPGLGRSRGGLTTKVHLAVDGRGLPLSIVLTPGNVNDATAFGQVLDGIRVPRADTGRPRTTPTRVLGDKAYSSRAIRHLLRRRGIAVTIPERRDQAANRRRRGRFGGRPPAFDKEIYRDRNVVERCFARLKQFRAIATRFDKLADRYRAGVVLASLILWLREPVRDHLSDTA
nr:IS5 family transposase [Streptomyces agglomeratus]